MSPVVRLPSTCRRGRRPPYTVRYLSESPEDADKDAEHQVSMPVSFIDSPCKTRIEYEVRLCERVLC